MPQDHIIEPPNDYAEIVLKFNGKLKRRTLARQSYAECLDPECPSAWTGQSAIAASSNHAIGSGHSVSQHYEATYRVDPNFDGVTIRPVDIDLPTITELSEKVRKRVQSARVKRTSDSPSLSQLKDSKVTPKK